MALFGKLFEKKTCDLCGGEIGLLGNRKLEDGNCCKKCASKLSPFFDERRHSTVADIRKQLEYRAANQQAVNQFHATRIIGRDTKIYLDETNGTFFVSKLSDYISENPDIISVQKIRNVDFRIDESHYEKKRTVKDSSGNSKQESFNPPHYHYTYNFKMTISVDHPYFSEIKFDVNTVGITIDTVGLIGSSSARRTDAVNTSNGSGFFGLAMDILDVLADTNDPRQQTPEYVEYNRIAEDMRDSLVNARSCFMNGPVRSAAPAAPQQPTSPAAPQAAAPQPASRPKFCTNCGAKLTSPTATFCEYCGSKLG